MTTTVINTFLVVILVMQAGLAWLGEPPTRFAMSSAAFMGAVGWLLLTLGERGR